MSIAILCPTKGRAAQYRRMKESAEATADAHLLFYPDVQGDDSQYVQDTWCGGARAIVRTPDGMPTVHRWNQLAKLAYESEFHGTDTKLFMLAADDIVFATPCWGKALLDHYNALENKIHVYALQDSRDPEGTPHVICTREWIEAMGYFVPPWFLHWQIDTWTVAIAKANGIFTHMKDYLLIHDKPSDQGKPDATHTGIRAMGWHERDAHVNSISQHILEYEKLRLANIIAAQSKEAA